MAHLTKLISFIFSILLSTTAFSAVVIDTVPITGDVTAILTSNSTTNGNNNTVLTLDPGLTVNVPAAGWYEIVDQAYFYNADPAGNGGTPGIQLAFGGTATVANITYVGYYYTCSALQPTNGWWDLSGQTSTSTVAQYPCLNTTAAAPSFAGVIGTIHFTSTGTFGAEWAQYSANGTYVTTMLAGSFIRITRIL